MRAFDDKPVKEALRDRVYRLAGEGQPLEVIRLDPEVRELLSALRPPDACEAFTHHRYLQALIQRAKNPDGTRRFVSIQQPLFILTEEDDEDQERSKTFYASLHVVERTPALKKVALRALQKLINGSIRHAGFIPAEIRDELIKRIGQVFDDMVRDLGT